MNKQITPEDQKRIKEVIEKRQLQDKALLECFTFEDQILVKYAIHDLKELVSIYNSLRDVRKILKGYIEEYMKQQSSPGNPESNQEGEVVKE